MVLKKASFPIEEEERLAIFQLLYTTCAELLKTMNYIVQEETLDTDETVRASHLLMIQILTQQLETFHDTHPRTSAKDRLTSNTNSYICGGFIRNFYTVRIRIFHYQSLHFFSWNMRDRHRDRGRK
jgi:hypothetical protein